LNHVLQSLFFLLLIKPLVTIVLGINIKRANLLPDKGPAVFLANHNSHLDTVVLMSLYPLKTLSKIRPVAAADYFLKNRLFAWFALHIMGIIPLNRSGRNTDCSHPLASCVDALDRGEILILFPEGTRGEPEVRSRLKSGVAHLAKARPEIPIVPVFMHGLGKALPRGEALFVPYICDIIVDDPICWNNDRGAYMQTLQCRMDGLAAEMHSMHYWPEDDDEDK
jgi:1-acyl-sn-glycerol-3-phosphate acyltransferase